MNVELLILIVVILALALNALATRGKIMVLEYRILLLTEGFAESQGAGDLAKQARDEINKKHFMLDKLMQS